jgi:hypothetical protein
MEKTQRTSKICVDSHDVGMKVVIAVEVEAEGRKVSANALSKVNQIQELFN